MVTTVEATWELGDKVADEFFKDNRAKELFRKTCDLWFEYKADCCFSAFANHIKSIICRLVIRYDEAIPFFDSNYCERIWIQRYNSNTGTYDSFCYYDCFFHRFVAFEEK